MSIKRVGIKIKNNKAFGLVAFLVDRDDFLSDVQHSRDLLGNPKIPYTFPKFSYKDANDIVEHYKKGHFTIYDAYISLREFCRENHIWLADLDKTLATAFVFASAVTKKYCNKRLYLPAVLASILVGCVENADFSPTYVLDIDKKGAGELFRDLEDDERMITIVVDSESSQKEVKETFNFVQKYYFGTKRTTANDGIANLYKDRTPLVTPPDTISNIKRDREWYWLNKSGTSMVKIAIKIDDENPSKHDAVFYQKRVEAAIALYKSRLSKPLK